MQNKARSKDSTYHDCVHPRSLRHTECLAIAAGRERRATEVNRPLLGLVGGFQYLYIVAEQKSQNTTKTPPVREQCLTGESHHRGSNGKNAIN